jgi:CHASE2 domain-containing sensor protein
MTQLFVLVVSIIAAFIQTETTLVTGLVLSILGLVIAWQARSRSMLELIFGLSAPAISLFCAVLILGGRWGPREAHEPIGAIAAFYGLIVIPLGIIALVKRRAPRP